ncbi:hypothetical protein M422DRAFT_247415 [Sphaerobolus stellatus SS14]|nr:hypothetical protein M422DRAFT_247415 [Sphaerobolus stellatus SS14]
MFDIATEQLPFIPGLDVLGAESVVAALTVNPLNVLLVDKEAKELESQVITSNATSKQRIALHGISFQIGLAFAQTMAALILLPLAWFNSSLTTLDMNEWMISSLARYLGVWSIIYILQGHVEWVVILRDFISDRTVRSSGNRSTDEAENNGRKSLLSRALSLIQVFIVASGGLLLGNTFYAERISAPHLWWLACGLIFVLYPIFISLMIILVGMEFSKVVIWVIRLGKYIE